MGIRNIWPFAPFSIFMYFHFTFCLEAANSYQAVADSVQCEMFPGFVEGREGFPSISIQVLLPRFKAEFIAFRAFIELKVMKNIRCKRYEKGGRTDQIHMID